MSRLPGPGADHSGDAVLAGGGGALYGRLGGPDFAGLAAAAQADGEAAERAREATIVVPPREDTVTGLPLP